MQLGDILFALREAPQSARELQRTLGIDAAHTEHLLSLLVEIEYIRLQGNTYELLIPVLDYADAAMFNEMLELHRRIVRDWLEENYAPMRDALSDITAVRQGLPYDAVYTQIWHETFAYVTSQLIARGVIADPYAPSVRYPGSYGVVWRHALYHMDWR